MPPDLSAEFPLDPDLCYLNHAAVAPWPRRTAEAVQAFARENLGRGAADYPAWMKVERRLRERLARLVNAASADDIALQKNTSEALSVIAYGLDWQEGDNLVGIAQEFPSNRMVWQSLGSYGVDFRELDLTGVGDGDPEAALMALCDERTRLLAVSSVQYSNGFRLDLPRLGAFCRERDILFCVDAIQSIGALPLDVQACQADFVVADGHKWMLGPEGLALFWSRPEIRDRLTLLQYGWHMSAHPGDFDRADWQPSPTATRFECGSPNMLGIHALDASISLLEEIGMQQVSERILANTRLLLDWLEATPALECLSDSSESRRSGIVTFRQPGQDPQELYRRLMAAQVICACRGGGVRFSPHCYTSEAVLGRAMRITEQSIF